MYYVDHMSNHSCVALVQGSLEHRLWTWHHLLGHPLLGYLERLFPSLAGSKVSFRCEAYILAKIHKHV